MTAKTVYSCTISDDEELLSSCAVLRELHVRGYQVYPWSVNRSNLGEYHLLCKKLKNFQIRFVQYLITEIETLFE